MKPHLKLLYFLSFAGHRHPTMYLHNLTARPGCIIIELDMCWHAAGASAVVAGEHGYDELNHAELLDLMGVQGLLTGGGNAVSITVC